MRITQLHDHEATLLRNRQAQWLSHQRQRSMLWACAPNPPVQPSQPQQATTSASSAIGASPPAASTRGVQTGSLLQSSLSASSPSLVQQHYLKQLQQQQQRVNEAKEQQRSFLQLSRLPQPAQLQLQQQQQPVPTPALAPKRTQAPPQQQQQLPQQQQQRAAPPVLDQQRVRASAVAREDREQEEVDVEVEAAPEIVVVMDSDDGENDVIHRGLPAAGTRGGPEDLKDATLLLFSHELPLAASPPLPAQETRSSSPDNDECARRLTKRSRSNDASAAL